MKVKLTPFTVLFLSLNSILIFCASRKIDTEIKPSSGLTHTNGDTQVSPGDNVAVAANGIWIKNTETPADKASYDIGYIIQETVAEDPNSIMEASANNNFAEASDDQKSEGLYGTFVDTVSTDRTDISSLVQIKIDAIANYSELAN